MKQPIFYFERFRPWDYISIFIYILVSVAIFLNLRGLTEWGNKAEYLFMYAFGTHLLIYLFNYKSLRNFSVYIVWLALGLVHLFFYFQLRVDASLEMARGHSATGLRNTVILLGLFQILRILSLNIQKQEFVAVSRSRYDLFDERRVNILDVVIFVIYFASSIGLLFLWK